MQRPLAAVLFVVFMLVCQSLGLALSPAMAKSRHQGEPGLAAAEVVLSQTGTIGSWAFKEPPGFSPVKCFYPTDDVTSKQSILALIPIIYPVEGVTSQPVGGDLYAYRRLPDGSLTSPKWFGGFSGTASLSPPFYQIGGLGANIADLGSKWVAVIELRWMSGSIVQGSVRLRYTQYQTTLIPSMQVLPVTDACRPQRPAVASLGLSQGTVNSNIPFTIGRFPVDPAVSIYFDGVIIGSVATVDAGTGSGTFKVPAAPMGNHTVKFYRFGRSATANFIVKPRIKLIPSTGLERGDTVNVSLRGFAKKETVRIRWKNGSSWVQVAQVVTSNTGSANVNVTVPNFAVIGANSVRGDGNKGAAAQTNAVMVVASASGSSTAAKASPTPTAVPPTATPTPTVVPPTETATSTGDPIETPATNTPAAEASPIGP